MSNEGQSTKERATEQVSNEWGRILGFLTAAAVSAAALAPMSSSNWLTSCTGTFTLLQGLTLVHFSAQPEPCWVLESPNIYHKRCLC